VSRRCKRSANRVVTELARGCISGGMKRDGRDVWAKRVARWRDSGLSGRAFATEMGINAGTLSYWAWKLRKELGDNAAVALPIEGRQSAAGWVEITAPGGVAGNAPKLETPGVAAPRREEIKTSSFELVLDARRTLRVPGDFDADALRRLLAVVEAH
jgi:hypothetical protein